jgi:hypothetical protein
MSEKNKDSLATNKLKNKSQETTSSNPSNRQMKGPSSSSASTKGTAATYANRQKLIGKRSILYEDQSSSSLVSSTTSKAAPSTPPKSKPIQILTKTPNTNEKSQQQQQSSTSSSSPQKPSTQQQLNKKYSASPSTNSSIGKSASTTTAPTATTPSVPSGTGELAPAASQLPIPFGLSSLSASSIDTAESLAASRNFLLKQLSIGAPETSKKPNDPLAILMTKPSSSSSSFPTASVMGGGVEDDKFIKLNKINKLRDALRRAVQAPSELDLLVKYFERVCAENKIDLKFVQHVSGGSGDSSRFYGEIFIETFRLSTAFGQDPKQCQLACFRHAIQTLESKSELAVKLATGPKRPDAFRNAQSTPTSVDFKYELYRTDSDEAFEQQANVSSSSSSLPAVNAAPLENAADIAQLNNILRSLILPKENASQSSINLTSAKANESGKELSSTMLEAGAGGGEDNEDNEDDDDDDENKSSVSDKRTK